MKNNTSTIASPAIDKAKYDTIEYFLNNIGGPTENEYVYLYNIFARKTHRKVLRSADDIFSERNEQQSFIKHIMLSNGDNFQWIYDSAMCNVFEE